MTEKIFEVFLTQEQVKFINQQLPKGYSLQFTTFTTRRPQPQSSVPRPLSEEALAKERVKPKTRPRQNIQLSDLYQEDSEEAVSKKSKTKKMLEKQEAKNIKQLQNSKTEFPNINSYEEMTKCLTIVSQLKQSEHIDVLFVCIDNETLREFANVIKDPIDLTKVEQKLKQGIYQTTSQFVQDVNQIWKNASHFGTTKPQILIKAQKMSQLFTQLLSKIVQQPPQTNLNSNPKELGDPTKKASNSQNQKGEKVKSQSQGDKVQKANTDPQKGDVPLTNEEKSWVYQNVQKLSSSDMTILCQMIQSYCVIVSESMELNLDTFPAKKAREVYDFVSSKLKSSSQPVIPPAQVNKSEELEENGKKKKKNAKLMDTPLTDQEKRKLGISIRQLPPEYLAGIWSIVQDSQQHSEVIEFDIDILPVKKARKLEAYVKEKTELAKKAQPPKNNVDSTLSYEQQQSSQTTTPTTCQKPPSYSYPENGIPQQPMIPQGGAYKSQNSLINGSAGNIPTSQYLQGQNGATSQAQYQALGQMAGYGHLAGQQQFSQQTPGPNYPSSMMMQQYAQGPMSHQIQSSLMGNYGGRPAGYTVEQAASQAKAQNQFQAQQYGSVQPYPAFAGGIPAIYSGQMANGAAGVPRGAQMQYGAGPGSNVGGYSQPTNYYAAQQQYVQYQHAQHQAQGQMNGKFPGGGGGGSGFGNTQPNGAAGKKQGSFASEQSSEVLSGEQSDG